MLVRSCAGFVELVYNTRTSPHSAIKAEVENVDWDAQAAFCELTRLGMGATDGAKTQWVIGLGGLGLCSCACHAATAFVSSVAGVAKPQTATWAART